MDSTTSKLDCGGGKKEEAKKNRLERLTRGETISYQSNGSCEEWRASKKPVRTDDRIHCSCEQIN